MQPQLRNFAIEALIFALGLALICQLYQLALLAYPFYDIDNAGFVDLIQKAALGQGLHSRLYASFYAALPTYILPVADYCHSDFANTFADDSFLRWHPYLIAWVVSLPVRLGLVTAVQASAFAMAASLGGLLLILSLWLWRRHVPLGVVALFIAGIYMWAPWAQPVFAQFYFDRLILPFLALLAIAVDSYLNGRLNRGWVVALLALLTAMISERAAMMACGLLAGYPILFYGRHVLKDRRCRLLLALAALCAAWIVTYLHFLMHSHHEGAYSLESIRDNLGALFDPADARFTETLKMFGILLPYLVLALFNWRVLLIALGAILPNLMLTIGGAERIGFLTHYHSTYLPLLLFAAGMGLIVLFQNPRAREWKIGLVSIFLFGAVFYNYMIDTQYPDRAIDFHTIGKIPEQPQVAGVFAPSQANVISSAELFRTQMKAVGDAVPEGAMMTASEIAMPALVPDASRTVEVFPVGLRTAQYAVVQYEGESKLPHIATYRPAWMAGQQACMQTLLNKDFTRTADLPLKGGSVVIYRRKIK